MYCTLFINKNIQHYRIWFVLRNLCVPNTLGPSKFPDYQGILILQQYQVSKLWECLKFPNQLVILYCQLLKSVQTPINMLVTGAHPWEWWKPPPFVKDICSYMCTHSFPGYPPFHCTKHYIAYCFPNASHVTFSSQPVLYTIIMQQEHKDTIIVNEIIYT